MRPLGNLSDLEFEHLVADLLWAEEGKRFQRFKRGRDGGIDVLHAEGSTRDVIQCKHYWESDFSRLLATLQASVETVKALDATRYRVATSQALLPQQKDRIVDLFRDLGMAGTEDVFGGHDIDGLLTRHPGVERATIKLWLPSGEALRSILHASVLSQSRAMLERISDLAGVFVETVAFRQCLDLLVRRDVCCILGPPGVGKSAIALALIGYLAAEGYEPIKIAGDLEQAWSVLDPSRKQVFLYDDFLGRVSLEQLAAARHREDISTFVRSAISTGNAKIVLTSRTAILEQARLLFEEVRRMPSEFDFALECSMYSRYERAMMLYSHLWPSPLDSSSKCQLVEPTVFNEIVDHINWSPRLVEYIAGGQAGISIGSKETGVEYGAVAIEALDIPSRIWAEPFRLTLGDRERLVLVAMLGVEDLARFDDLHAVWQRLASELEVPVSPGSFSDCVSELRGTFVREVREAGTRKIEYWDPSLIDFLLDWIASDETVVRPLLASIDNFECLIRFYAIQRRSAVLVDQERELTEWLSRSSDDFGRAVLRLFDDFESAPEERHLGLRGFSSSSRIDVCARLEQILDIPSKLWPSVDWVEGRFEGLLASMDLHMMGEVVEVPSKRSLNRLCDSLELAWIGIVRGDWQIRKETVVEYLGMVHQYLKFELLEADDWVELLMFEMDFATDEEYSATNDRFLEYCKDTFLPLVEAGEVEPETLDRVVANLKWDERQLEFRDSLLAYQAPRGSDATAGQQRIEVRGRIRDRFFEVPSREPTDLHRIDAMIDRGVRQWCGHSTSSG